MRRFAFLVMLLLGLPFAAGAAWAQTADAPQIIGWRCYENRDLTAARRAFLEMPVMDLKHVVPPGGYSFHLYETLGSSYVTASAHWFYLGDSLDGPESRVHLYFTIPKRRISDGTLIFEAGDGSKIRLEAAGSATWASAIGGTTISIKDDTLARRFLAHDSYKVSYRKGSRVTRLAPLEMFAIAEARPLFAEMLAGLKRRAADPERLCTPQGVPEPDDNDIVVT